MSQSLKKWGNSLGVRIPRPFAEQLHWEENTEVETRVVDGRLVVEAVQAPRYTLDQLLEGMTSENIHAEVRTGGAVGNEEW